MKTHTLVGVGITALLLGGFAAGGVSLAGNRDIVREASESAGKASKALSKGDAAQAVALAESAVTLAPRDAGYRMLLGQSYLKAGRFVSAHQAFADVLELNPGNGKAALNLALAEIAQGQWDVARRTLTDNAAQIPDRDRGLAWALAGDPNGGVEILMAAARTPQADARTRQNLALVLALSGRWSDAKTVVSADVSPQEADKRILEWVEFAKPVASADQVAKLLGVVPAKDAGQPVALALNAVVPAGTAVAAADPVPVVAPVVPEVHTLAAIPEATPSGIVFAARREVVQTLPARAERRAPATMIATKGAFKTRVSGKVAIARAPASGIWYVQLGAYDSAGVARDAWGRATRRFTALSAHTPAGMAFKANTGAFYRLSVGGFARADAVAMCRAYRVKGGTCFVRPGAGDQVASWVKPSRTMTASRAKPARIQMASR